VARSEEVPTVLQVFIPDGCRGSADCDGAATMAANPSVIAVDKELLVEAGIGRFSPNSLAAHPRTTKARPRGTNQM
jgi:hypothetical protein